MNDEEIKNIVNLFIFAILGLVMLISSIYNLILPNYVNFLNNITIFIILLSVSGVLYLINRH